MLWFRAGSINFRECDMKSINSNIKSWVFADQLKWPEELVLHRPRDKGGLNLINTKYKAAAERIRSFLETAIMKKFRSNLLHAALFQWKILLNIPNPGKHPYLKEDMFSLIREVKEEGLLNLSKMKLEAIQSRGEKSSFRLGLLLEARQLEGFELNRADIPVENAPQTAPYASKAIPHEDEECS